jgi:hypothetical protein
MAVTTYGYDQWAADVKKAGGVVTRYPFQGTLTIDGTNYPAYGLPASRSQNPAGGYTYSLAPLSVQRLEIAQRGDDQNAIDAGKQVEQIEQTVDAAKRVAGQALDIPRSVVSSVTGIPSWLIPIAILALLAFAAKNLIPDLSSVIVGNVKRRTSRGRK